MMIGRLGMGMAPFRGAAGASVPAWSPFDLGADLLAFWDAEQTDSITLAGSLVTSWADRISGAAAVQGTSAFRPVYSATSFNGRPGVASDGTDDYLRTATLPAGLPVGSNGSEVWALASQDFAGTQAANQNTFSYGEAALVQVRAGKRLNVTNTSRAVINANSINTTESTTDYSGIHVTRNIFAAALQSVSVDGGAAASNAVTLNTAASGNVTIFATGSATATRFWKGPMSALIVTNPLSAPNAALLLAYLKARGGLP